MVIKTFLNTEGHHNHMIGSKVTVILMKGWILPIGGAALLAAHCCSFLSLDLKALNGELFSIILPNTLYYVLL